MTRRIKERIFDPAKPLIARREFTANGRLYSPGDSFEWQDKSLSVRRVYILYSANFVDHPDDAAEALAKEVTKASESVAPSSTPAIEPKPETVPSTPVKKVTK